IDTGINPIPELAGVLTVVPFRGDAQGGGTSGTLSPGKTEVDYSDHMGHGTMMASVAHRQAPRALIYAYNALPDGVQVYANEALAHVLGIVKADKAHRHIVSISASGDLSRITAETMHSLIRQLVALDCPVVCAAGNDGKEALTLYPACFPEPITVVAVKNDGTQAEFSNWLGEADFAEIGKAVPCCDKDGRETTVDGTSPATACVAGKLAALWSKDLGMTEPQLYEAAKANARDFGTAGRDPYYGWGWIASMDMSVGATPPSVPAKDENEENPVANETRLLYLTTPRMSGADVYALEMALEALGYDCKMSAAEKSSKQGIFGPACDAALRAFQRDYAVDVYGKTCPDTLAALASAQPAQASPASRFIAWLKARVGDIYVWGAQGETNITEAWIRKKETSTANANRAIALWKKRVAEGRSPLAAWDCSGLIVAWLLAEGLIPGDLSSRGLWRLCTAIKKAQLKPGDLVFRRNALGVIHHVGVYIGSNKVIEAKGRDDGVVERHIDASGSGYWTDAGRLDCLK
ncbi:MAG TPA: S8 family serine peptidase, partial [Clostridia bacterium]|nr:S8 family serine peptidase [Clostridia bacterium]